MSRSRSTLLHGEYLGQIEITPSPSHPVPTTPLLPSAAPTSSLADPLHHEITAAVKQVARLVKDQLAPYPFDRSIRFKLHFHQNEDNSKIVRVRRYPRHYTVSLNFEMIENANRCPENIPALVRKVVYQLIKRANFSGLPLRLQPDDQAFSFISSLSVPTILLGVLISPMFFFFAFVIVIIATITASSICDGLSNPPLDGKLPRQLLRHWNENQAREFIDAYGTIADRAAVTSASAKQHQRHLQKSISSSLKAINRSGDLNE